MKLSGKVALITGAARGQGRSHCIELAKEGASIIGMDLCQQVEPVAYEMATPEDLNETKSLVEAAGGRMLALHGDVRDSSSMDKVVEAGLAEFGHVDIVCGNAGILGPTAPFWELSEEGWSQVIDIDLSGLWRTAKAVVPSMIERAEGGSIILTISTAGLKGYPNCADYSAAKHGAVGLLRVMAIELAPYDIRVNGVHPMNVNTKMLRNEATQSLFAGGKSNPDPEDYLPAMRALHAMDIPYVEPEEVSAVVRWLASDDSKHITGVTLPLDGGGLLK